MVPGEEELQRPGPVRELWARAAVRERFRAGELLSEWIQANAGADKEIVRTAKRAALELQNAAKPALGADGLPAHRLGTSEKLKVMRAIGAREARKVLERTPPSERTEAEALLAQLLAGGGTAPDVQDRDRLVAFSQMAPMASAAGVLVGIDTEAVRQHVENLDFLNLLGGPDLHRFVGRADELANLRRVWNSGAKGPIFVEAPGGMGKSMLIARFVADLLETPEERPTAVFHIDFDRRDMQSARPAIVLSEMLRQALRWVGSEKRDDARRLAATAPRAHEEDYHGQSRGLEAMGVLADRRAYDLIRLLDPTEGDFRIIIVADSAEQVFGFDDVAAESPYQVASELSLAMAQPIPTGRRIEVMLIYGARSFPPDWANRPLLKITLGVLSRDEAKAYLRAEAGRATARVSDEVLSEVIEAVGRSPLALRLAARLLASEDARTDPKTWVLAVRNDTERIQATLYDRVLKRLRDPNLQKLAQPGLLLRRLTPAVVEQVLAGPCKLDLTKVTPAQLIADSAREGQLFFRDVSDPDPQALWHRPDVRALMLPDLDAMIDAKLALAINAAALDFYAGRDDTISRAEEIYHRLRLDQPESELTPRWSEAAGERLKRALDEFPIRARDFVRSRLGAASLAEVEARLERSTAHQPQTDAQPLAELRRVVRRELQRGAAPLETLMRYNVDTLDGVLGDAYAEALVASGQTGKLLVEARDLRAREGIAPYSVRAAVFATAAGVLEGQGKLGEALAYWTEARMPPHEPDEEAVLTELGGRVGWLRTRRKLGLIEGREAELKWLAQQLEQHASALVSRPVLLRELVAELGDLLLSGALSHDNFSTYQRLLGVLFETEQAFPSAVADPRHLGLLSGRLGFGPARSPRMLGDLATKAAYTSHGQPRVVALLREEVEWTLAKALSRGTERFNVLPRSQFIVLRLSKRPTAADDTLPISTRGPNDVSAEVRDLSDREFSALRGDSGVLIAPNMPIELIRPVADQPGEAPPLVPADASTNWGIKAVRADLSKFTGAGITVAVLDTGIDQNHPTFKDQGIAFTFENFTTEVADDIDGHGTHCAGTIFGRSVDGRRIGVAPGITNVLIGKVIGKGGGSTGAIYKAILWAMQNGAHIISMSLGMDFPLYRETLAMRMPDRAATALALDAYRANVRLFDHLSLITRSDDYTGLPGVVVVAAAGNESRRPDYRISVAPPASAEQFLSVGALAPAGKENSFAVAYFSNSGPRVVAPGVDILSARLGGGLTLMSGTSMASSHVAGVAALWAERMMQRGWPFRAAQVIQQMEDARIDLSSTLALDPDDVGRGLVQAP